MKKKKKEKPKNYELGFQDGFLHGAVHMRHSIFSMIDEGIYNQYNQFIKKIKK